MTPAVAQGLSLAVATGLYGVSFGALGVAAGLDVWQTVALSLFMFTGGSQFAFIGVLAGGGGGGPAFAAGTLLGVRNVVYGMQIIDLTTHAGESTQVRPRAHATHTVLVQTLSQATSLGLKLRLEAHCGQLDLPGDSPAHQTSLE